MRAPVAVGELVRLREADYRYGVGDLVLRVTSGPTDPVDPGWMDITGAEIAWNDQRGHQRQAQTLPSR
jgi:hypothetical protein